MAKLKLKEIAYTALGSTAGAFGADFIDDKLSEQITDDKQEIGAKIILTAIGAYASTKTKGPMRDAIVAATGQFGFGAIETGRAMMSEEKPTKGIEAELQGIYDEIEEAMKGANDVNITGDANDIIVTGNDDDDDDED